MRQGQVTRRGPIWAANPGRILEYSKHGGERYTHKIKQNEKHAPRTSPATSKLAPLIRRIGAQRSTLIPSTSPDFCYFRPIAYNQALPPPGGHVVARPNYIQPNECYAGQNAPRVAPALPPHQLHESRLPPYHMPEAKIVHAPLYTRPDPTRGTAHIYTARPLPPVYDEDLPRPSAGHAVGGTTYPSRPAK